MATREIGELSAAGPRDRAAPEKVLVWVSWVTPAGGLERVALSLANGLARRGRSVVLAGPYSKNRELMAQVDPAVDFIDYNPCRTVTGLLKTERFLNQLISSRNIQVVSAHGSVFPLLRSRVPVVWTEHGLRYGSKPILAGPRGLLWRAVRTRLRSGDWRLVSVSRFVVRELSAQFGLAGDVAKVIYNGVPAFDRLAALPPPRFEAPYRLGYLGRLDPEKHPIDIFDIDSYLRREGVECRWSIFGAGALLPHMRELAERQGSERFEFHGVRDVVDAFSAMDMLVFTSRGEMEGLPTVLLEAQAARRPAFAWRATCIPEAAGPDAILVDPPFDPARAAAAIACALRGDRPRPSIPSPRWKMDSMLDEYEEVLAEAHARSSQSLAAHTT